MAEKIFKGFELITEANFNSLTSKDKQKIYFVRTSTGTTKEDGFIYFNGKKYGTGKLSSDKIQKQLTDLKNTVDAHIANKATVTADERTTQKENGNLTVNDSTKWLSGAAIAEIKKYVDSEDVKSMNLTEDHKIQLKNKAGAVLAELNASKFIKDGMLESVTLTSGTTEGKVLRFTWNTANGKEKTTTDIEVSEFFHEISGDTNTITVTQPSSGTTGSLKISAKTVENVSGVTSGATALMTGGITQQYVAQEINKLNSELPLSATNGSVTYATAKIAQTDGKLSEIGSGLDIKVATGLTSVHAGFVYNNTDNTFTANATTFAKTGLLDAKEVIDLLRYNNTNIANALTYLKGQITTVTGSDYITVTKAEDTNNYTVSASGTLQTAINNANSAVKNVNGKSGNYITIYGNEIMIGGNGIGPNVPESSINDVLTNIYTRLNSEALTEVVGSSGITVSEKESGSQTISVNAKHLNETEKAAGQIEIITTGTTGIYGLLYFGGDDVE